MDRFRYIKIQPKTVDLRTRLWRTTRVCGVYSLEQVYCVRLKLNISKLVYEILKDYAKIQVMFLIVFQQLYRTGKDVRQYSS